MKKDEGERKMKKTLLIILALVMCLSLCACGGKGNADIDAALQGEWRITSTSAVDLNSPIPENGVPVVDTAEIRLSFNNGTATLKCFYHKVYAAFEIDSFLGAEASGTYKIGTDKISLNWKEKNINNDSFAAVIPEELPFTFEDNKLTISGGEAIHLGVDQNGNAVAAESIANALKEESWHIIFPNRDSYYEMLDYYFQDDNIVTVSYNYRVGSSLIYESLIVCASEYTVDAATNTINIGGWFHFDPAELKGSVDFAHEIPYSYENGKLTLSYAGLIMEN